MYRNFLKGNIVSGAGTQKSTHAEKQDEEFPKWPSKSMSERRTRRRSTGAISM